ncbi:hypothetical protein FHS31_002003 [Sphingomonas vulcanisoli]|uniref:Glycerophosphoryl diester phosphodiesterase membrane domain-containing protein n=1 Tax=Sphingomonas vulcanisoli TaxID=1658060 RepID=A0ABX0TS84_9SPHN|nr:hypothetical protein [Sphingomonas vulcanisoli]NIJ08386.1 hypothetical protein [Sphingomonas vulcanisoli]
MSAARKISIERALRSVQGFARSEWRLALPVALAFLGMPQLVVGLFLAGRFATMPQTMADLQHFSMDLPWWWTPILIVMLLVSAIGGLALIALALVPRISVREALVLAFRRFPLWLAAIAILLAAVFVALLLVMIVIGLAHGGEALAVAFTFLAMLAGMLFAALLLPVIIDRRLSPVALLREGAHLYRHGWGRISAGLLLYLCISWIVMMALQVSIGSVVLLVGRLAGAPDIGGMIAAVLASLISAIAWAGFALLVAGIYRQVAAP